MKHVGSIFSLVSLVLLSAAAMDNEYVVVRMKDGKPTATPSPKPATPRIIDESSQALAKALEEALATSIIESESPAKKTPLAPYAHVMSKKFPRIGAQPFASLKSHEYAAFFPSPLAHENLLTHKRQ